MDAMHLDVVDFRDFYASPVGQMVARHLAPVVRSLIRTDAGTRVLGFGFPTPYLASIGIAERVFAFMPAGQGVIDWSPAGGAAGSATALVEEDSLPLPGLLHRSGDPRARAGDVGPPQRADGGTTPRSHERRQARRGGAEPAGAVGAHRPLALRLRPAVFRGQLRQLFAEGGFEAEAWTTGLHMAPTAWRPLLGAARDLDRIGRLVWPAFAGVIVVSAVKRTVQGMTVRARPGAQPGLRPALRPSGGAIGRFR